MFLVVFLFISKLGFQGDSLILLFLATVSSSLKKASKSQTARARACAEQNAYRPTWQLVRAVACAILYALGVTCARAMSPRVKQNGSHLSKKWMNILLTMLFILSLGDFEWWTDMTEVVLDVKLASLGVLNITPRGLTDFRFLRGERTILRGSQIYFVEHLYMYSNVD